MARKTAKKRTKGQTELERVLAERRQLQQARAALEQKKPGAHAEIRALTEQLEQLSARATELIQRQEA